MYFKPNKPGFGHGKSKGRLGEQNFPGADYTKEEVEWLKAVSNRRAIKRTFLINNACEILKLAYDLGYRKQ